MPVQFCRFPESHRAEFREYNRKWNIHESGASVGEREDGGGIRGPLAIATAFEVALIFAGILAYIWRWQHTSPRAWMALLALILVSHVLHRDTLRGLGLGRTGLRASAQWVLPLAILLYLPMLFYGFAHHRLALLRPTWQSLVLSARLWQLVCISAIPDPVLLP